MSEKYIKCRANGHLILYINNIWVYADTGLPYTNNRKCTKCNKYTTKEGHDACLGTLPEVKYACCGHGIIRKAYIMYNDNSIIEGKQAINTFKNIKQIGI